MALRGTEITNPGPSRERSRGDALHRLVSDALGIDPFVNRRVLPDIAEQVLEVKLQTAGTVDLGRDSPDDPAILYEFGSLRYRDIRYAVFYATHIGSKVRLDHVVTTTGEAFFMFFQRCEGIVVNRKLQIPLPNGFFGKTK